MTAPRIDTVMEALSAEQRMGAFTTGMLLNNSVYIQSIFSLYSVWW